MRLASTYIDKIYVAAIYLLALLIQVFIFYKLKITRKTIPFAWTVWLLVTLTFLILGFDALANHSFGSLGALELLLPMASTLLAAITFFFRVAEHPSK